MSRGPQEIDTLIEMMSKLPGLGPRSARRAVLHLIRKRTTTMAPLAAAMERVAQEARECTRCRNITTSAQCDLCRNPERNSTLICVVQDVADLWAMERAGAFSGLYHVLGGTLSALDAVGPDDLGIPELISRLAADEVQEVILALPATMDGQTTAHYIADEIEERVRVTSLAQGVPIGGELDYLDDGTIMAALSARKSV